MSYTIAAALASKNITECYVSTEDPEIARVAKEYGAGVIDRPSKLAGDFISTFAVVQHAAEVLRCPPVVVILQPTSPLRTARDIDQAFELFSDDVDTIVGVCEFHGYAWEEKNGYGKPRFQQRLPRQKMEKLYTETGALYITRGDVFKRGDSRLGMGISSRGKRRLYVMDKINTVDLDSREDLMVIASLMDKQAARQRSAKEG